EQSSARRRRRRFEPARGVARAARELGADAASGGSLAARRTRHRRRAGRSSRRRPRARRPLRRGGRAEGRVHARRHRARRRRRRRPRSNDGRRGLRLRQSRHGDGRHRRRAVRRDRRAVRAASRPAGRRARRGAAARARGRRCRGGRRRARHGGRRSAAGAQAASESPMTADDSSGEPDADGTPARAELLEPEAALVSAAGETARRGAASRLAPLVVTFSGDLGSGKTTWVRAMLRGLGYRGRVPSPTYTLVEHYPLPDAGVTVVHLDLYRLADDDELDNLGLRDWLAEPATWLLVEWPERSAGLRALADVEIVLEIAGPASRRVRAAAKTARGREAVGLLAGD